MSSPQGLQLPLNSWRRQNPCAMRKNSHTAFYIFFKSYKNASSFNGTTLDHNLEHKSKLANFHKRTKSD